MTAERDRTKPRLKRDALLGVQALELVVREVAPSASDSVIRTSIKRLKSAATLYRMGFVVRKGDCLAKESAKVARDQLLRLADAVSESKHSLKDLGPRALSAFTGAYGKLRGPLAADLRLAEIAARCALETDRKRPSQEPDHARAVLASKVAATLRDELRIKLSIYIPVDSTTKKRRGGGYFKVLAATAKLAGIPPILDLRKLMKAGIQLLKDPQAPQDE